MKMRAPSVVLRCLTEKIGHVLSPSTLTCQSLQRSAKAPLSRAWPASAHPEETTNDHPYLTLQGDALTAPRPLIIVKLPIAPAASADVIVPLLDSRAEL
jgi:hypothetical protein